MVPLFSPREPVDNLRGYASKAILPKMEINRIGNRATPRMPAEGHASHRNLVHFRPNSTVLLTLAFRMKLTEFQRRVVAYTQRLPDSHADHCVDKKWNYFAVAAAGYTPQQTTLMRPMTVTKVAQWVEVVALMTAQAILHSAFPGLMQWRWHGDEDAGRGLERELIRELRWRNHNCAATPDGYESNMNAIAVFVQPPWVLSPKDFQQFTSRRKLHNLSQPLPRGVPKSSERLWGKLWQTCNTMGCHWFVITSYGQWAFGVFSTGWSTAFITPPMLYSEESPTIMQCLCYWMMSSIGGAGTFKVPEVGDMPMKPWRERVCTDWDLEQVKQRETEVVKGLSARTS